MSFRDRLLRKQQERKASWNIIELDYALSWVLAAIGEYKPAKETLIFKGGTCLKKCYFGENYRFSEDLDFTADPGIEDAVIDQTINLITQVASSLSINQGGGVIFSWESYEEKEPHPFNQRAYTLRARFPWHKNPYTYTKIKLEISRDEELAYAPNERSILHGYGESFSQTIKAYALEEILAEKYRGILQNQERFRIKGWIRSRVRDFYDLWHILKQFKDQINFEHFYQNFTQKCLQKGITFEDSQQFFNQKEYLERVKKDWDQFLNGLTTTLPSFEETIIELEKLTEEVFKK